jgi:transposase
LVLSKPTGGATVKTTTIAIDLSKSVFEIGISHQAGHVARTYRLSRRELPEFMASQPAAEVVMEACGSSHYWSRRFQSFGHQVKLLPPHAVRPYVHRSKTDRADVKGMLEASRNADIHPVPVKTESQQQLTALHRMRSGWIRTRTMRINCARGLLAELGIVLPQGAYGVADRIGGIIEDAEVALPSAMREVLHEMILEIRELERRIKTVGAQLEAVASDTPVVERLQTIPGIGPIISTALVGFVGDAVRFRSSRQFACYLGLTPREHSSGARRQLGRISKRGDVYLRKLLVQGAHVLLVAAVRKPTDDRFRAWALSMVERRGRNKAVVAVANKMARMVWAVWTTGKPFRSMPPPITNKD